MAEPAQQRRIVLDTDTAGDDTQAILLAALSPRIDLDSLTVVAGNVAFEDEVANAKHALEIAGVADEVPVYEGARSPLVKDHETVEHVHGKGGLGGNVFPDPDIASAAGHAATHIVETARASPGEVSLVCIGPLTNVALACRLEPNLNDLLDGVWVMGGAVNTIGNDTPSAEYNFWVDPDAAKVVVDELDATLVDWGLCQRQGTLEGPQLEAIGAAADESRFAEFFLTVSERVREFTQEKHGIDATTQPDSLTVALFAYRDLVERSTAHFVDVDEREGMTRGYSLVDELSVLDETPTTEVVEEIDEAGFAELFMDMLLHGDPEHSR
ncbi:MAG: nucleoside hydrolase [Halolamina sp.]